MGVEWGRGTLGGCGQNSGASLTWRMGLGGKREAHWSRRKEHVQRSCGSLKGGNWGGQAQRVGERLRRLAGASIWGWGVWDLFRNSRKPVEGLTQRSKVTSKFGRALPSPHWCSCREGYMHVRVRVQRQ